MLRYRWKHEGSIPSVRYELLKETHMIFRKKLLGAMVLMVLLAGCFGSYYTVRDPASGTAYYTTDVGKAGGTGAVKFKDEKTGSTVTLQSSEVKEISKDEFAKQTKKPAPAAAAPAPAPAAAPAPAPAAAPAPAPAAVPAPPPAAAPAPAPGAKPQ